MAHENSNPISRPTIVAVPDLDVAEKAIAGGSSSKVTLPLPATLTPPSIKEGTAAALSTPEWPSVKRRWICQSMFMFALFIDVMSGSAFVVYTGQIATELNVSFAQQSWVVTSYSVTFASFLLLWGRVSDLYSPRPLFSYGLITVGLANIVLSFLPDQYSFFIIRALTGIAASALVPSAYRLIAVVIPPEDRSLAYTLYGMTGSLANSFGVIVAGLIGFINKDGLMSPWRWFFRIVAIMCIPVGIFSIWAIPKTTKHETAEEKRGKWKRLDITGTMIILVAIILFILALTLGATYSFRSPAFLVPFLVSLVLFPLFFYYESRLPTTLALLPPAIWSRPNFAILIVFAFLPIGWWVVNFIPFIEMFIQVHGESSVVAAVRTLPQGIAATIISFLVIAFPKVISQPRWSIIISLCFAAGAYVLWTQAPSVVGRQYWEYVFPGMVFGSAGMQVVLLSINVCVMMAVPPSQAGVAGAVLQTAQQTSVSLALAIQAGFLTMKPGGIHEWINVRTSWYFELGWTVVWLIGFIIFYRPSKNVNAYAEDIKVEIM